jgi:hypothetical protein
LEREESNLLLVTTEVDADHTRIIDNVLKFIQYPSDNYLSNA